MSHSILLRLACLLSCVLEAACILTWSDIKSKSRDKGNSKIEVAFHNDAKESVQLYWVDREGNELPLSIIAADEHDGHGTYPGHVFVARRVRDGGLLMTREILHEDHDRTIWIEALAENDYSRWPEFDSLVVQPPPCSKLTGPSMLWTCTRYVSDEEVAERDPAFYGFTEKEARMNPGPKASQIDMTKYHNLHRIWNVTPYEKGYIVMNMTSRMKEVLFPWYEKERKKALPNETPDTGDSIQNNREVAVLLADVNNNKEMLRILKAEVQQIAQWWTQMQLRYTATYGVRIYQRNSALLNHLDREHTHLASAILQVSQQVDADGGWPLEVYHPNENGLKEIFLQPGQMVLYEGARVKHGRPMRLKGKEFANIFMHFCPVNWSGPDVDYPNPHYKGKPGSGTCVNDGSAAVCSK